MQDHSHHRSVKSVWTVDPGWLKRWTSPDCCSGWMPQSNALVCPGAAPAPAATGGTGTGGTGTGTGGTGTGTGGTGTGTGTGTGGTGTGTGGTGTGGGAAGNTGTGTVVPAPPTMFARHTITDTAITGLAWTAVSGATGYNLEYSVSPFSTWTAVTPAPTTTTADISGLTAATEYHVRVNAVTAGGTTAWSAETTVTTAATGAPTPKFTVDGKNGAAAVDMTAGPVAPKQLGIADLLRLTFPSPYWAVIYDPWGTPQDAVAGGHATVTKNGAAVTPTPTKLDPGDTSAMTSGGTTVPDVHVYSQRDTPCDIALPKKLTKPVAIMEITDAVVPAGMGVGWTLPGNATGGPAQVIAVLESAP